MCEEATWQLRSMNLKHTCGQSHMVGIMHTSWLSRAFKNKVEHNPKVKIKELGNKAQMKWNLTVTTSMAARSRQAVLDEIQGEYKKQYKRIADYYSELLRANPGSSVTLKEVHWARWMLSQDTLRGQLLTAIDWDPNDRMLPIAYAVFEVTFMSDQQKGLLLAFDEVIPGVDHRFCIRHLYSNFRKKFSGLHLKQLMWRCTKATHWKDWERDMAMVRTVNMDAHRHLSSIPPRFWSRSRKKIERRGRLAGEWRPCWSAVQTYEVVNRLSKYTVDLSLRERFYKKWKLSGIPCTHTISCINFKGLDMHSYVDDYYKRDAYVKCYDSIINPLNGSDLWEHTNFDDVMSPPYRKPSHRPVKKRKRGPDESEARIQTHLSRRGQIQWCSNCGASGHKRGRCSNPPLPAQPPKQSAVKKTNGGRKRSISKPAVQSAIRGRKRPNTTSAAIPQQRPKMKPIRSSTQPPLAAKKKGTSSSSQPVMNKVSFSHNIALHISPRKLRLMTKLPPRT
ncbi:uncharacterized protein [Arachis hypogaea]|uniref:uncharacterized protein n=1 Tax=Arachis hypogaea TaxID=3818 RepID=UPI003B218E22